MKVPVKWLNSYLDTQLTAREAAEAMERAGIEVEEITAGIMLDPRILVGHVREVSAHPNADKLRLAKVDVKNTILDIVCGAPNLEKGQKVAVATVGAKLPDGTRITEATIRGEKSRGMICSERELGMGESHEGILVLDADAKVGQKLVELFPPQDVIDIATAANRWDLTSIIGVAREVAAHSHAALALPKIASPEGVGSPHLNVKIASVEDAERYMVARLSINPKAHTPDWMRQALEGAGVRPVSVVVDITNYVLLEVGQPLHAFNAQSVHGAISVRRADKDEKFTTLDSKHRVLSTDDIVIADEKGVIGLAGVMGGLDSEVSPTTTEIILESATFHPGTIRRSAVHYGLRSEASARFERGVPHTAAEVGMNRAIGLLQEFAGAKLLEAVSDVTNKPITEKKIIFGLERISAIIGIPIEEPRMIEGLGRLGLEVAATNTPDEYVSIIPWWRQDIQTSEDIAEEVIKLIGYELLPATLPEWKPQKINFDNTWARLWQAKSTLRALGLFEVVTYSFIGKKQITDLGWNPDEYLKLENPLSSEQEYLRAELLPSLLAVAARNRRYAPEFGVFEFSKVFHKTKEGDLPDEPLVLGVLCTASGNGYAAVKQVLDTLCREFNADISIKPKVFSSVSHPSQSAAIEADGTQIGSIFTVHPNLIRASKATGEIGYLEINWSKFMAATSVKRYRETSKYPSIRRDISVMVEREISWQEVSRALVIKPPLASIAYIGDYYGKDLPKGKKVVTIRLEFVSDERTLTDAEADTGLKHVISTLHKSIGAIPRG